MASKIILTTDGARKFLAWLETREGTLLDDLMTHPGYRVVVGHSGTWGDAVTAASIIDAIDGRPSRMYGLKDVGQNVEDIRAAADYVEANRDSIISLVEDAVTCVFPTEMVFPIGLHCIVGYDWGIGLYGNVCINLNSRLYLDDLREIGYMLVHEATHVAYERAHGPIDPAWMHQPGGLRRLVNNLIQNEGLAVYSPLQARIRGNCLDNKDYRLLDDPATLARKKADLKALLAEIDDSADEEEMGRVLDLLSSERLSYVVGCAGFVQLEEQGGMELVRKAALWPAAEFVDRITS